MPRTTSRVNKSVQIKATTTAKRARVEEAGLGGPRVGKVSSATRSAQARRDARGDSLLMPAEMAKGRYARETSAAGPTAGAKVAVKTATKKPAADSKARQRRTGPLIEVRTASSVKGSARLDEIAEEIVTGALSRFMPRLTRIDVHLSDANADKRGENDKHCQIEVRPASQQPVSATAAAGTIEKALTTAVSKMKRLLAARFGRERSRHGRRGA